MIDNHIKPIHLETDTTFQGNDCISITTLFREGSIDRTPGMGSLFTTEQSGIIIAGASYCTDGAGCLDPKLFVNQQIDVNIFSVTGENSNLFPFVGGNPIAIAPGIGNQFTSGKNCILRSDALHCSDVTGDLDPRLFVNQHNHCNSFSVTEQFLNLNILSPLEGICGIGFKVNDTGSYINPLLPCLSTLENQTNLIAKDIGTIGITSVSSQVSCIAGMLSNETLSLKELIAPSKMMVDLQSLALKTYQSIVSTRSISEWDIGIVDSASYLVSRQVDWVSKLCYSDYGRESISHLPNFGVVSPNINVVSSLPRNLELEKAKKKDITPKDALIRSTVYNLTEKGKRLVDKIVCVNQLCDRIQMPHLFKYTGGTMKAAAIIGGTIGDTRDSFGNIIDGLYMFFYENLARIKELVGDFTIRNESVFQCIFRIKHIRTDFRHDYEHGSNGDIRSTNQKIGDSYHYYCGKHVLSKSEDYMDVQDKIYDDFEKLADHLLNLVESKY